MSHLQFDPSGRSPAEPYVAFEGPSEPRGCLFYGCVIACVLFILGLIFAGVSGYLAYSYYRQMLQDYTSTTPVAIPKVELGDEQVRSLDDRVKAFRAAMDRGEPDELVLNADEVNTLIARQASVRGKVFVRLKNDEASGQISVPLEDTGLPGTKGRFINGSGTFKVSLRDGHLVVIAEDLEVNGRAMPAAIKTQLRNKNLAEKFNEDPDNAETFARFESVVVKDDKVVIKSARRPSGEATPAPPPDKTPETDKDEAEAPAPKPTPPREDEGR